MGETIEVTTADGPMPAALAEPVGTPKGGIVVIQEAFGLTDHIVDITKRLADAGWLAVAPALFHRQGSPVFDYGDYEKMFPVFKELTADGVGVDVDATIAAIGERGIPKEKTGIVGFCMGGTVVFHTVSRVPLGAGVTFYGGGVGEGRFGFPSCIDAAPNLKAPWLGLYGDLDKGIPVDEVEALRVAVKQSPVDAQIVRYPEADHGFNCDARESFHAPSAGDAWERTLAWFDKHLAG
jgi:carboxymethylenebutenolidase